MPWNNIREKHGVCGMLEKEINYDEETKTHKCVIGQLTKKD